MKNFDFLLMASDSTRLNARAYSTEEKLRKYMRLFDGSFGGISVDKSVDDIIEECKRNGHAEFNSHSQFKYRLMTGDYVESYMDFGVKTESKKMNEASTGGRYGASDPNFEPPTKLQFLDVLRSMSPEENSSTLVDIINEIGDLKKLESLIANQEDYTLIEKFLHSFVSGMNDADYQKYVASLY